MLYEGKVPIDEEVFGLTVHAGKRVDEAVQDLMSASPSRELELPNKSGGPSKRLLHKLGLA